MTTVEQLRWAVEEVRESLAPDPRTHVFEVHVEASARALDLVGAVSDPGVLQELRERLDLLDGRGPLRDRLLRLPDPALGARRHAVVTAAMAPLHAESNPASALLSQAPLGSLLLLLRSAGRWFQCRGQDGYLGWVHQGYLRRMDEAGARRWALAAGGESCLAVDAEVRGAGGEVLARLPWGARVVREPGGRVRLPDGRRGAVHGIIEAEARLAERYPHSGPAVVNTARRWMRTPYLWGGTSPAGADCSGLVQAVFRFHGVSLPRDSDQQAAMGRIVDPGPGFARLRPADLLFFAEVPRRITHVALSTGGAGILHASLGNGEVDANDLTGTLDYERELAGIFVCAARVL
jgi:gamma-D-glutamyl-L-lysine dipeptidyl-peptidase